MYIYNMYVCTRPDDKTSGYHHKYIFLYGISRCIQSLGLRANRGSRQVQCLDKWWKTLPTSVEVAMATLQVSVVGNGGSNYRERTWGIHVPYIYIYVICMYVYIYIYVCMYICNIYIYIHTHTLWTIGSRLELQMEFPKHLIAEETIPHSYR